MAGLVDALVSTFGPFLIPIVLFVAGLLLYGILAVLHQFDDE